MSLGIRVVFAFLAVGVLGILAGGSVLPGLVSALTGSQDPKVSATARGVTLGSRLWNISDLA